MKQVQLSLVALVALVAAALLSGGALAWLLLRPAAPAAPAPAARLSPDAAPAGWPCRSVVATGHVPPTLDVRPTAEWRTEVFKAGGQTLVLGHAPGGIDVAYLEMDGRCEEWLNATRLLSAKCRMHVEHATPERLDLVEDCRSEAPAGVTLRTLVHPFPAHLSATSVDWERSTPVEGDQPQAPADVFDAPAGWPCRKLPRSYTPAEGELPALSGKATYKQRKLVFARDRHGAQIFEQVGDVCIPRFQVPETDGNCELRADERADADLALVQVCRGRGSGAACVVRRLRWQPNLELEVGRAMGGEDPCAALLSKS